MNIADNLEKIRASLPANVTIIAVSKTHPAEAVQEAYDAGQRVFGENKAQEMTAKYEALPKDIEWHMIGHMQTNKVKYIAPYVSVIHSVDSVKLLEEINKKAAANNRTIDCLLQLHIAEESHKFGFSEEEIENLLKENIPDSLKNVRITGLMGMATFTEDHSQIRREFKHLKAFYEQLRKSHFAGNPGFNRLSMGMSGDYGIAVAEGSNMVRIGSAIFGVRNYQAL